VTNGTAQDLGIVKTGVAVKSGELHPHVHDAESLRSALCAASAIFLPDPQMSTAGIHVMKVLRALGLADTLSDRLRPYANGNTAMNAMAVCAEMDVVGLTQVTEILITPGVDLVANLPKEFELATVYTAAIARRAASPLAAEDYIAVLAGNAQAALRSKAGFLPST
jgi:molybdate transport system substrate-binding protein